MPAVKVGIIFHNILCFLLVLFSEPLAAVLLFGKSHIFIMTEKNFLRLILSFITHKMNFIMKDQANNLCKLLQCQILYVSENFEVTCISKYNTTFNHSVTCGVQLLVFLKLPGGLFRLHPQYVSKMAVLHRDEPL